jgi:hypothetical protein
MSVSFFLATLLFTKAAAGAPNNGQCCTETLLDVQVNVEMIQTGTTEHGRESVKKNGHKVYDGYSTNNLYRQTIYTVTVQLGDVVYTAQSESFLGFGFRPTSFIIHDPITACVHGNALSLERPDGKQYKAHLFRAIKVPPSDLKGNASDTVPESRQGATDLLPKSRGILGNI